MKYLAALLLLCPLLAHAQANTAVLTCTAPTTNTDGTALTAAQKPITFVFYEGTTAASQANASPAQATCGYTFTGLAAGTHYFSVSTVDARGGASVKAAPVSKGVVNPPPVPQPPTNLTVLADPTAYEIRTTSGALVAARIGRVELGTVCTPESQTVAGVTYNRVEMRAVDLVVWPSASPNTVKAWARCS